MTTTSSTPHSQFVCIHKAATHRPRSPFNTRGNAGKSGTWTAEELLDEASRRPGHCGHVDSPRAPTWLLGDRESVEAAHLAWQDQARKSNGRRWPRTAPVLAAAVVSLYRAYSPEAWRRYRDDSIAFFRERFGRRVVGVCEHDDESQFHIHVYLVPEAGESFGAVFPGFDEIRERQAAAQAVASRFPGAGERQEAFERHGLARVAGVARAAFTRFQDDFYEAVARHHGLARTGPKRERLEREIYLRTTGAEAQRAEAAKQLAEATAARQAAEAMQKDAASALQAAEAERARASEQAQRAVGRLIDEAKAANREFARLLSEFADLPDVKKLQAVEAVKEKAAEVARATRAAGLDQPADATVSDYRRHPGYINTSAPVRPTAPSPFNATGAAKRKRTDEDDGE